MLITLLIILGRESFLIKVEWVNDWPVFNNGRAIKHITEGRGNVSDEIRQLPYPLTNWEADLSHPDVELGWYTKRMLPSHHLSMITLKAL
jgi:beta-xylosidase